jgi:hypothetical protein
VGCSCLQLKLLSLQGDKSTCTVHQLQFLQQGSGSAATDAAHSSAITTTATTSSETDSQQPVAAGAAALNAPGRAAPPGLQPQSLSQLDELRLLIQQLHQPGTCSSTQAQPSE